MLILLALFDPSPTPGAQHRCTAALRVMAVGLCPDPAFPAELVPCPVLQPPMPLACEATDAGELRVERQPGPGEVVWWDLWAENGAGRSESAEPVTR